MPAASPGNESDYESADESGINPGNNVGDRADDAMMGMRKNGLMPK